MNTETVGYASNGYANTPALRSVLKAGTLPSFGIPEVDANFAALITSINKYAHKPGVGGMPWFYLGTVCQELADVTKTLIGGTNGQI